MSGTDAAIRFESVAKVYRRGMERANLRAALPGRFGRPKTIDGFWALRDVDLEVQPAEIVGIIGPNGAGKSTTLKLVARVVAPTTGRVTTRGRIASLIELGVGFHPDLTGSENVRFSAAVLGMSSAQVANRYDEIVEFAGIQDFMGTPVKRYSSGMLARLGFAVASHLDAEIVLVDEVMSVGDAEFQRRGFERMRELRQGGATLLFVTHNLFLVAEICQRAIRLDGGRIVDEGGPAEVVERYLASTSEQRFDPSSDDAPAARIVSASLSATAVAPRQPLDLRVSYEVIRPVELGRVSVVVTTMEGLQVAGTDIPGTEATFQAPGRYVVDGSLEQLPLVEDTYRVVYTLVDQIGGASVAIDQASSVVVIMGQRPDRVYGSAALQATWGVGLAD